MSKIENKCKEKGVRLTDQRRLIAKVMSDSKETYGSKDHPDVDELHKRVTLVDKNISIATVYRTVGGPATNIGAGSHGRVLQWGSKYVDGGNAFNYNEGINAFTFDTPNTTGLVNYKLYVASGGGNQIRYIDQTSENSIVATEIAQ